MGAEDQPRIKGKVVLVGKHTAVPVNWNPPAKRTGEDQVRAQFENPNRRGGRGGFGGGARPRRPGGSQSYEAPAAVGRLDQMLLRGGALMRHNDTAGGEGIIVGQQHRAYDPDKNVPTVILGNADYGRIERLLADGEDMKVEFNIVNKSHPRQKTSYDVIAEIPGSIRPMRSSCSANTWIPGTPARDLESTIRIGGQRVSSSRSD